MRLLALLAIAMSGCSSVTFYYPAETSLTERGEARVVSKKALQLYGDSIGSTQVDITRNGLHYASAGGIDNSTTTGIIARETSSVAKWGIGWGFSFGILKSLFGNAASSYAVNQARPVAAPARPLPSVGSTIPAQTSAVVTPVP